jgi:hypothetical protein
MNITVQRKEKDTEEGEYPFIGERDGIVILFSCKEEGTVLQFPECPQRVGHFEIGWDMDMFSPFHGTITLEN